MAILFFRTVIIFVTLIVLMRILGKRQMGELELSELVVSVLIADLAALPLQDIGIPMMNGLIPILILFACELILAGLTMRSVKMRALICGTPCMLIRDGQILQEQMRLCRFTVDELTEELRSKDIIDISQVKYAILETDGTLNTILFAQDTPPTARQLGLACSDPGYPYIVIDEGRVMSENLRLVGRDARWLAQELKSRGASSPEEVYIMIVYENGGVYYAAKERKK